MFSDFTNIKQSILSIYSNTKQPNLSVYHIYSEAKSLLKILGSQFSHIKQSVCLNSHTLDN